MSHCENRTGPSLNLSTLVRLRRIRPPTSPVTDQGDLLVDGLLPDPLSVRREKGRSKTRRQYRVPAHSSLGLLSLNYTQPSTQKRRVLRERGQSPFPRPAWYLHDSPGEQCSVVGDKSTTEDVVNVPPTVLG